LLLEKYSFSCWTPFDEQSVTAHIAVYVYTEIPVLMLAIRQGYILSVLLSTIIHITLQFKLVNNSLEYLSKMENSESPIEKTHSDHQKNRMHVKNQTTETFKFLLQMVNRFTLQDKHRSLNALTNPSSQSQTTSLLTV
jgi:hypothetical protein